MTDTGSDCVVYILVAEMDCNFILTIPFQKRLCIVHLWVTYIVLCQLLLQHVLAALGYRHMSGAGLLRL